MPADGIGSHPRTEYWRRQTRWWSRLGVAVGLCLLVAGIALAGSALDRLRRPHAPGRTDGSDLVATPTDEGSSEFPVTGTVRAKPSLRLRAWAWGRVIGELPDGSRLEVLGVDGDFYRVRWRGRTGFAHRNFIAIPGHPAGEVPVDYPPGCKDGGYRPRGRGPEAGSGFGSSADSGSGSHGGSGSDAPAGSGSGSDEGVDDEPDRTATATGSGVDPGSDDGSDTGAGSGLGALTGEAKKFVRLLTRQGIHLKNSPANVELLQRLAEAKTVGATIGSRYPIAAVAWALDQLPGGHCRGINVSRKRTGSHPGPWVSRDRETWKGWCLGFVNTAWGRRVRDLSAGSAYTAYLQCAHHRQFHAKGLPPPGAAMFLNRTKDNPFGHAFMATGLVNRQGEPIIITTGTSHTSGIQCFALPRYLDYVGARSLYLGWTEMP